MAPSRRHQHGVVVTTITTAILIICLIISPSKSDEMVSVSNMMKGNKKQILGSRPPECVNKCLACKPCMATLVIPPHRTMKDFMFVEKSYDYRGRNNHDSYYLLAWKCKCGNKLFEP